MYFNRSFLSSHVLIQVLQVACFILYMFILESQPAANAVNWRLKQWPIQVLFSFAEILIFFQ